MTLIPPQRSEPHTVDPGTLFEALANAEHSVITTLNAGDYILVSRVTDNMQLDRRLMTLNDLQLLFSQPAFSVTGDITSVGNVTTIAQDVVTFAKMQNVTGHSMLARVASTSGDLSEVTLDVNELIGRGDTGNIGPITLGAGLQMVGREISATNTYSGTVTTLSVATANGISGSVATATSTPVITLTLGAITPSSVNGVIFQAGTGTPNLTVNGAAFVTGTNSGDQTISDATITFSDITTGNFTISQHGFVPKGTNLGKFLRDDGTWATVASGGTVTEVTSANIAHATIATGTTTPVITIVSAPILTTARTIGGVSFDGSANITVATATGGFTVSGGNLALTTNSITMTGSIGETGSRITKLWATDIEVTNAIAGSITGNAATVTNATLTTALTVNTGTVTLTGNVANNSVLTIGAGAVSVSGSNTGDQTISDATISITDITTNNASITQHGFLKKLSNSATEYMDGTGNWSTPAGGYTNLTSFVGQTAWRVFYSNTDGDVTELALGADGTFLKSNGATSAPTFAVPVGSGDVSKVGTPANNQIGVWTGDGTIEGASSLTYDGANLQLTGDIGATGSRITKGWFTDLQVTNAIAGSITGNAATVTNATLTTALTVNTGTVTLTGNVANTSVLTIGAGAVSVSGSNTGDQTSIVGITGTKAQFDTAVSDGNIVYTDAIGVSVQAYDADLTTWAGITPGTGVATALAVAVGSAGAFVTFNGAGGTPSSMTATNLTGTATALNIGGNAATATLATTATTATGTNALYSATTTVNVSSATAPTAGQVLTATGASAATWQTPAGGAATAKSINQVAHGLAVNDVIKFSGSSYAKAQADSAANAEVVGVVTSVADADNFTFTMGGYATVDTLTADTVYFLSPTTAGLLTSTEPTTAGQISKPVLKTLGTTTAIIGNMRGMEISASASYIENPMTTQGDIIYGGSAGAPTRLAKGTASQVLAMNSGATAPEWVTPASGGDSYTVNADPSSGAYYSYQVTMERTASTSFVGWSCANLLSGSDSAGMASMYTTAGSAYATKESTGNGSTIQFRTNQSKNCKLKWRAKMYGVGIEAHGLVTTGAGAYADQTSSVVNIRIVNNAGTLYACHGDGSNNVNTNINTGITDTDWHIYGFEFNAGTNIKFYIDGVLVATHTTNLPNSTTGLDIAYGFSANGSGMVAGNSIFTVQQ